MANIQGPRCRAICGLFSVMAAWPVAHPATAFAQLPAIGILTEADTDSAKLCQVGYSSASAAARSALRYNRVDVKSLSEVPWRLYININAMPINRGSSFSGMCAIATEVSVVGNQTVYSTPLGQSHFAKVSYCERGGLAIWDAATAQATINDNIKGWVDECIAEIEDTID